MSDKLAIVIAPTGALNMRDSVPFMAYTAEEQGQEAQRCEEAGAAIYHVHVRDEQHANSGDPAHYSELVAEVRKTSNALIQIGGALGPRRDPETGVIGYPFSENDRLSVLRNTQPGPDMFSVKIGAVELQVPDIRYANIGLRNSPEFLREAIPTVMDAGQCLELEIFDVGALYNAKKLEDEGLFGHDGLKSPGAYLHFVMGHGGQPATLKHLLYMCEEGRRLFPNARICVAGAGDMSWPIVTTGILLGVDMIRVGIEDTHNLANGQKAASNVEIVEAAVGIAQAFGREIATVADVRDLYMPN